MSACSRSAVVLIAATVLAVPLGVNAAEPNPHPLVVDPAGDGSNVIGTEASPPRTDVLAVDITDTPATVTFSMRVVDLDGGSSSVEDAVNPPGHDDYIVHVFTNGTRLTAEAARDLATGATTFGFYVVTNGGAYSGVHSVAGSFDGVSDTVDIVVPTALIQALFPAFGKGTVLLGIESFARSERRQFSSSITSPYDTADDPEARYVVGR